MRVSQALVVERMLGGGFARPSDALLRAPGARLQRASELASPAAARETLAGGTTALERLLPGGLPRGVLVEIVGGASCGRFSLSLAALAAVTSTGQPAALVDVGAHLDPEAAEQAGVDLERLLWVRPTRVKQALAATEMLLAAGFPLVVADLGLLARTRFIPDAAWVRLARSAAAQRASLLLSTPVRASGISAEAVVSASAMRPVWKGTGKTPRLLAGISSSLTLEKLGRMTPGSRASMELCAADTILPSLLKGPVPPTGATVLSSRDESSPGRRRSGTLPD